MPTVQSAVLEAPERLVQREFDQPTIGPDEGLLQVELAGICGTDWKSFHGKLDYPFPLLMGHEILGRIAVQGEGFAARHGVQVGDRVVVESTVPCGVCQSCKEGVARFCKNKRGYGTVTPATEPPHLWGAFAQYMYLAPGTVMHKIDATLPPEAAVIAGVIANGVHWVRNQGGLKPGDVVVIQGCGPQGLACTASAHARGAAQVIVTGLTRDENRLELAREFGAHRTVNVQEEDIRQVVRELTDGRMADLVVDVSGSPDAIATSVDLVRKRGTMVLGGLTGTGTITSLQADTLVWNEIRLQGVFTKGSDAVVEAVNLIESRRFPFERMVTHRYPLARAEEAIRAVGGELPGVYPIKAVVVPGG